MIRLITARSPFPVVIISSYLLVTAASYKLRRLEPRFGPGPGPPVSKGMMSTECHW